MHNFKVKPIYRKENDFFFVKTSLFAITLLFIIVFNIRNVVEVKTIIIEPQMKREVLVPVYPNALPPKIELSEKCPQKIDAPKEMQEKIDYACKISDTNDFIYTLEAETGSWDTSKQSHSCSYINGGCYYDRGICQINEYYHPEITNDKNFSDWKWQIEKCWELYDGGTTFYGKSKINQVKSRFIK